jgi:hypothetical protein
MLGSASPSGREGGPVASRSEVGGPGADRSGQVTAFGRAPSGGRAGMQNQQHGRSRDPWGRYLIARCMDGRRCAGRPADHGRRLDRVSGRHARHLESLQPGREDLHNPRAGATRAAGRSCRSHLGFSRSARSVRHVLSRTVRTPRRPNRGDVPTQLSRTARIGWRANHLPRQRLLNKSAHLRRQPKAWPARLSRICRRITSRNQTKQIASVSSSMWATTGLAPAASRSAALTSRQAFHHALWVCPVVAVFSNCGMCWISGACGRSCTPMRASIRLQATREDRADEFVPAEQAISGWSDRQ